MKIVTLAFLVIPFFSYAGESCLDIKTSDQSYVCSFQKRDEASLHLKKEYDLYINSVIRGYSSDAKLGEKLLAKIRDSQSKWVSYMNVMCDIYSFQIEEKSRSHEIAVNSCIADMSDTRRSEIVNMINNI